MSAIQKATGRRIVAVDMHVHPNDDLAKASGGAISEWTAKYFGRDLKSVHLDATADLYRGLDMMCCLLALDKESATGLPAVTTDHVAEAIEQHPDVFFGLGSIDPYRGKYAVKEVERAKKLGLKGMKFQQIGQAFDPSDTRFYPIWEACQALGMVVLFHMGTTGIGAGAPGGFGFKLKYGRPILVDDVAADFPNLTIVAAHPAFPWADEGLAMCVQKGNVYMDLSGYAPKYFPPNVVQHARTRLQDKCMFGSDWPLIAPQRWVDEFLALGFSAEINEKILWKTANKVFNLGLEEAPAQA